MTSPAHVAQAIFNLPTKAFGSPALVNPGQEPGQQEPPRPDGLPSKGSLVLMDSLKQLDAAVPGYVLAEEMYDGEIGDIYVSDHVMRLLAKSGINDVEDLNYAKVPVDTIAEKLQIRAVTAAAGDEADSADEDYDRDIKDEKTKQATVEESSSQKKLSDQAAEKIEDIRKRNQLDSEEGELHLKVSKYGDAYLFVWPVVQAPEDDPDAFEGAVELDQDNQGKVVGVDMFVNSPLTVRMFYDPENPLRASHVLKSWQWIDEDNDVERRRATLYFRDRIERWVVKLEGDSSKKEDWEPFLEYDEGGNAAPWPAPNPYDRLPFFHFRTCRTYGKPEHLSAYGPQRLINKLVSAHAVTVDFQSFPQRYALTDPRSDDAMMNLIDPDNPEDDDDDPEGDGHSQLRADPAAVWKLRASQVGQFAAADPAIFMGPLDRYIKAISELCGIPLDRFVGYTQPPSGDSRRAANEVLYEKTGARHKNYGGIWADSYEFALELLGMKDITVKIQWKPAEIASGIDDWAIVEKKISNGIPVKQALMEAGYPEDEVEKWLLDQGGADLVRRVALLTSIGTAVQALAAGVGVGMVSSEQAGDIVARVLGTVGEDLPDLDKPVELFPQQQQQMMNMQQQQRTQQLSEFDKDAPPEREWDPQGRPLPARPARKLPDLPPPPPPVKVGKRS